MIHTVHYESQDQRFEPREPRERDLEQGFLHFSLSLHLQMDTRLRRARHTLIARITTIFAAFVGALSLALGPIWVQVQTASTPPRFEALFGLARFLVIAGALLGVGAVLAGGIPLVIFAWRTSLRNRLLLLVPVLASLLTMACALLALFMMAHGFPRPPLIFPVLLFYGGTVVSTMAIICSVYRAKIADKWLLLANRLGWLVVAGMLLLLTGTACWGLALLLIVPGWSPILTSWLILPGGIFLSTMVALWAAFWNVWPSTSQSHPHDTPSFGEPQGEQD